MLKRQAVDTSHADVSLVSQWGLNDEVVRATEENAVETAQVRAAMIKQRQVKDDTFLVQDDEITWVAI